MKPIRKKLWESVSLTSLNTDKFKTSMLALSLCLPLTRTLSANDLLLSGVLRRGTEKYRSVSELNERLDDLYASSVEIKNLRCGKNELFIFTAEMLDNAFVGDGEDILDGVCEVISQMLLHPITEGGTAFPEDTVKKERANVTDAINAEMNNPKAYAHDRCAELMHRSDENFPTVKEMLDTVKNADGSTLYAHYRHLLENSSIEVFYVGSESAERVSDVIKKHFSAFSGIASAVVSMSAESFESKKEVEEEFPVCQGKLCMGFRVGVCADDEDYFASVLFNEVFGGSPASKLFMNVREKLGLCYYCSSAYDAYRGNITVSAGINVCDLDKARGEILSQLEDMRAGRISEIELCAAKKSLIHWHRQMFDYPQELFAFYSTRALFGIDATPEEYMRRFESVSAEQIADIARGVRLDTVYFLKGTLDGEEESDNE